MTVAAQPVQIHHCNAQSKQFTSKSIDSQLDQTTTETQTTGTNIKNLYS
jgi:hypothetical protein